MNNQQKPTILKSLMWFIFLPALIYSYVRIRWYYYKVEREVEYELNRGNQQQISEKYPWIAAGVMLKDQERKLSREIELTLDSADHFCAEGDQGETALCYERYRRLRDRLHDVQHRLATEVFETGSLD